MMSKIRVTLVFIGAQFSETLFSPIFESALAILFGTYIVRIVNFNAKAMLFDHNK